MGADTLTYSGRFSDIDGFLSREAEDIFTANGGRELCDQLGYPNLTGLFAVPFSDVTCAAR